MKENVLKRKDFLNLLAATKNRKSREGLVNLATTDEIRAIAEIVRNSLKGNVPLDRNCLAKMKRHKKRLRLLSQKRYPVREKRELTKQTGGIWASLIPVAVSTVASLLGGLKKKKKKR